MAQKLVDDIDGTSDDVATYLFSVGGETWEIDLTPKNLDKLKKALEQFIKAGRPQRNMSVTAPRSSRTTKSDEGELDDGTKYSKSGFNAWRKDKANGGPIPVGRHKPEEVREYLATLK
jgi:hypothetical protein